MNRTLVMLRPHAIDMREEIFGDLEKGITGNGKIIESFMTMPLSACCVNNFYGSGRSSFPYWWDEFVESELAGKEVFVVVYEGDDILPIVRKLIGSTQVLENPFDTIRGKYGRILLERGEGVVKLPNGKEIYRNIIHSTDETPGEFEREFDILDRFRRS